MPVNRVRTTGIPASGSRVAPVVAGAPADASAPATDPRSPDRTHDHGHGQAHASGHGPTPRPRRAASSKANKNRRRKRSSSAATASVEDDEPEVHEPAEAHATSVVNAITPQGEHQDGGDDQDEGGNERSRHARHAFVNHIVDGAAAAPGREAVGELKRQARARQSFEQALAAAASGEEVRAAQLEHARALAAAPRTRGGRLEATADWLVAHCPRPDPASGPPSEARRRLNCMRVIAHLQAYAPRTPAQAVQQVASLEAQAEARFAARRFAPGGEP